MKPYAWLLIGAVGASVLWAFAIAWLIDVIAAQRKALCDAQVTLRLYRETRGHSDTQIRAFPNQLAAAPERTS
jgi:hypothetical protein